MQKADLEMPGLFAAFPAGFLASAGNDMDASPPHASKYLRRHILRDTENGNLVYPET